MSEQVNFTVEASALPSQIAEWDNNYTIVTGTLVAPNTRQNLLQTQLTVGEMITLLKSLDAEALVPYLKKPHSYRGWYQDLAFEYSGGSIYAGELLKTFLALVNTDMDGYKGGTYRITERTLLWLATIGENGIPITGVFRESAMNFGVIP